MATHVLVLNEMTHPERDADDWHLCLAGFGISTIPSRCERTDTALSSRCEDGPSKPHVGRLGYRQWTTRNFLFGRLARLAWGTSNLTRAI